MPVLAKWAWSAPADHYPERRAELCSWMVSMSTIGINNNNNKQFGNLWPTFESGHMPLLLAQSRPRPLSQTAKWRNSCCWWKKYKGAHSHRRKFITQRIIPGGPAKSMRQGRTVIAQSACRWSCACGWLRSGALDSLFSGNFYNPTNRMNGKLPTECNTPSKRKKDSNGKWWSACLPKRHRRSSLESKYVLAVIILSLCTETQAILLHWIMLYFLNH